MNQFSFKNKTKDGIICFICGSLVFCLFSFVEIQGNRYMGIIAGIIICIFGINSFLFNHNAYIQIENNYIRGKYHWFSKINCSISDIVFVLPQMNTISILLKNGKRHVIMGIENPWKFYSEIISKITFDVSDSSEVLIEKLNLLKAKKKKILYIAVL